MARPSRASRRSLNPTPVATLEYDALAVQLQESLGTRVLLVRAALGSSMRNARLPRGARMEALFPILLHSCADPKQLLFGVDDDFRHAVSYARDTLARTPAERAWVDGMTKWIAGADSTRREPTRASLYVSLAQLLDRVVGGRRFTGCAALGAS
ncbi:hypothetical protein BH11GEM2_BH11GEM2_13450 [soil metagenome]